MTTDNKSGLSSTCTLPSLHGDEHAAIRSTIALSTACLFVWRQ